MLETFFSAPWVSMCAASNLSFVGSFFVGFQLKAFGEKYSSGTLQSGVRYFKGLLLGRFRPKMGSILRRFRGSNGAPAEEQEGTWEWREEGI